MTDYEVMIEDINPCGGARYSKKTFIEVSTDSPEEYIKENGRFPIMETGKLSNGDIVITTGDGSGNIVRYTFTE